ncbi:Uncharacterized protein dnm_089170 [Desulfonema magnum]|uniref:Uncharacterized protein n=1 Tax=Desulfonema magnum TaxID=45655 RepID=A0A975BW53_9BACT|nr:Uncharacterized protein dnm_089170 [Desulfonema magnum]
MLIPPVFTSRKELGMQPKLLCPRRSRFAPFKKKINSMKKNTFCMT